MHRRSVLAVLTCLSALGAVSPSVSAGPSSVPLNLNLLLNQTCSAPANVVLLSRCMDQPEASYIAESMPSAGLITVSGTQFRWPGQAPQALDSVGAASQPISVKAGKGYRSVALLVAGHRGARKGEVTITYTDGSKVRRPISAADWFVPAGKSALKGVEVQQYAAGAEAVTGFRDGGVYLAVAPIDAKKAVAKINLPSGASRMIVFAVSLSPLRR